MTLQEYFATPETVKPQELIFGEMRVAESPTTQHQEVVGRLFLELHRHVVRGERGTVWLAPLDVVLDTQRALVVQPDLFVILDDGAAVVRDRIYGAPDVVIEVLSPKPRIGDIGERVGWFRDYGARECWLVDQLRRQIEVLEFRAGVIGSRNAFGTRESIVSGALPALHLHVSSVLGF
jgi:Uma2 family endonuclease